MSESDLITVMKKGDLIEALQARLTALRAELKAAQGPYQRAMRKHVKHVAAVLLQASKEVASGELKPSGNRGWCEARSIIEARIGEVPRDCRDLQDEIKSYEAAIHQVRYAHEGDPMRVSTSQVERWLRGRPLGKSMRRLHVA